jgi:mono/diheme cytochrome c family protein
VGRETQAAPARPRRRSAILVRGAVSLTVTALGIVMGLAHVHPTAAAADQPETQAERGAAVYDFSCATCHGRTGKGFSEAVSAFPEDHRYCVRCHGPLNPPQMNPSQIQLSQMAFSLGDPPPLDERERIARFGTALALYHYVRAAMPRWDPGRLSDDEYLDVTTHLLRMVGIVDGDDVVTFEDLVGLGLE